MNTKAPIPILMLVAAILVSVLHALCSAQTTAPSGREIELEVGPILKIEGSTITTDHGAYVVKIPQAMVAARATPPSGQGLVITARDEAALRHITREIQKHYVTLQAGFDLDDPKTQEIEPIVQVRPDGIHLKKGLLEIHLPTRLVRRVQPVADGSVVVPVGPDMQTDILLAVHDALLDKVKVAEGKQLLTDQITREPDNIPYRRALVDHLATYESTKRHELLRQKMDLLDLVVQPEPPHASELASSAAITSREIGAGDIERGQAPSAVQYFVLRSYLDRIGVYPAGMHRTLPQALFLNNALPPEHNTGMPPLLFDSLADMYTDYDDKNLLDHNVALATHEIHGNTIADYVNTPGAGDWPAIMPRYFHFMTLLFVEGFPKSLIPTPEEIASVTDLSFRLGALASDQTLAREVPVRSMEPSTCVAQSDFLERLAATEVVQNQRSLRLAYLYAPLRISFLQLFLTNNLLEDPDLSQELFASLMSAGGAMFNRMADDMLSESVNDEYAYRKRLLKNITALGYMQLHAPTYESYLGDDEYTAHIQTLAALEFANSDLYIECLDKVRDSMTESEQLSAFEDIMLLAVDNVGPNWFQSYDRLTNMIETKLRSGQIRQRIKIAEEMEKRERQWRQYFQGTRTMARSTPARKASGSKTECPVCDGTGKDDFGGYYGSISGSTSSAGTKCGNCSGRGYLTGRQTREQRGVFQ